MDIIDLDKQIIQLKDMTRSTGALHDAQVYQLKMYPLVVLQASKSQAIFNYKNADGGQKWKREVIFDVELSKRLPKDFKKRLDAIGQFTQQLLGEEYTITVKAKGKPIFTLKGDPNAEKAWATQRKQYFEQNTVDGKGNSSP